MLEGFRETSFSHDGKERPVYRRGRGPGVLVIHEIPGITPEVAAFARSVADAGFDVALPVLFGTPGRPFSAAYVAGQMIRACVSREFAVLAAHRSTRSPTGCARSAVRCTPRPAVRAWARSACASRGTSRWR